MEERSPSECTGNEKDMEDVFDCLKFLRKEVLELYLPKQVPEIKEIPEPLEFYRNWVAPNIPVLIKGGIQNWPAVKKWKKEYLCQKLEDGMISVSVTPNGYADAIRETEINGIKKQIFVLPEERRMTISEFYEKLETASEPESKGRGIFYIQKQNSNLTEEFPNLLPDIDENLLWASEAFNEHPTAINLWIGDSRAVTSLHKDPFENIYCVVSGFKEFILLPPTDRPWLPYEVLPVGQYKETNPGMFDIIPFNSDKWMFKTSGSSTFTDPNCIGPNEVPWIDIDPLTPNCKKYPLYSKASPIHVTVSQGDALYLPSLWYHHVRQSHMCIAVNYWYDMRLDIKYAYFQMLEKLSRHLLKCN